MHHLERGKMKKILKNKWFVRSLLSLMAIAIIAAVAIPLARAGQPRDNDSNAIVYGGFYSVSELKNKINHGTGKPHQSGAALKSFIKTLGISQSNFDELSNGTVYKDGRVVVKGKVVFRNAKSMGRQWMPGSVKDNRFPYPIYVRKTSVSFASNSIPAYVHLNYDGTMAWALIKSCGNPVIGVGEKKPPVVTHNITIKKFNDKNGNGKKESNEPWLANWSFKVTGPSTDRTVKTNKDGSVKVKGLKKGTYTVTEIIKSDWKATTPGGVKQSKKLSNKDITYIFGNQKIVTPESKFEIVAKKFEDVNGNKVHDEDEAWLADWSIRLSGNGITREFLTNGDGEVDFRDLPAGTYTVSEQQKSGWTNTTPLVQTVIVDSSTGDGYVEFGNQQIPETITTTSTTVVTEETLPASGPVEVVAGTLATMGIGGAGYMYRKSRLKLKGAYKKF